MKSSEYVDSMDAAVIRAAIKVLADFSGGNANVSQAIRLLRDEEFTLFKTANAQVEGGAAPVNCSSDMNNCPDDKGTGCWCRQQVIEQEITGDLASPPGSPTTANDS